MTKRNFCNQFPAYPISDFPPLPEGFADSSWVNDICPTMRDDVRGLTIFCDYADPAEREIGGPRFSLHHGEELSIIAEGEEWQGMLDAIAQFDQRSPTPTV